MGHAIHNPHTHAAYLTTTRLPLSKCSPVGQHQAPSTRHRHGVCDPVPFLTKMAGACMQLQAGQVRVCLPYVVLVWVWAERGGKVKG